MLEHGDTMFMPGGYWHHMEYLDGGFAAEPAGPGPDISGKLNGLYHPIAGLRSMNNLLIKMAPEWWYHYKRKVANERAEREMRQQLLA